MNIWFCLEIFGVLVFLWHKNGSGSEGAVTYTVAYPSTADSTDIRQVDLLLVSAYSAVVQIDGQMETLTPYTVHNITKNLSQTFLAVTVTTHDAHTSVTTIGRNSAYSMDAFRPLPIVSLGNDYTLSSWPMSSAAHGFIVLASTETDINITVEIPTFFQWTVNWKGVTHWKGSQFIVSIDSGQVAELKLTEGDPTGIRLTSAAGTAFSVLSGVMEPTNGSSPGAMYDVMLPYNLTGNFYVGVPLPGCEAHSWRLVSTTNDTEVEVLVGEDFIGHHHNLHLDQGQPHDLLTNSTSAVFVFFSVPAMVTFVKPADNTSPPTMTCLCPMHLWKTYYVISPVDPSGAVTEYVTIVIENTASDGLRMTSHGGVMANVTGWMTFDPQVFTFHYTSVALSGALSLWHVNSVGFQVIQSAFSDHWAYSFSAGCDSDSETPTTQAPVSSTVSPSSSSSSSPSSSSTSSSLLSSSSSSSVTSAASIQISSLATKSATETSSAATERRTFNSTTPSTLPASTSSSPSSTTSNSSVGSLSTFFLTSHTTTTTTTSNNPTTNSSTTTATQVLSSSSSLLPNWLDENEKWVIMGCCLAGALLLGVSVGAMAAIFRKHRHTYRVSAAEGSARHGTVKTGGISREGLVRVVDRLTNQSFAQTPNSRTPTIHPSSQEQERDDREHSPSVSRPVSLKQMKPRVSFQINNHQLCEDVILISGKVPRELTPVENV